MPYFSVIIPVYKAESWLRECVDSVLGQTFRDLELILVDDGSPDGCPAVCDEYARADNRVRVIHQTNSGVAAARNNGLDAALGEMAVFMDSDDYWCRPTMLEEIWQICQAAPETDVVYFKNRHLYPDGHIVDWPLQVRQNFEALTPEEQLEELVRVGTALGSPCLKSIRRTYLTNRQIRFPENVWAEDVLWDMEVAAGLPANRMLDEYCYMIRCRDDSRSSEVSPDRLREYLQVLDRTTAVPADSERVQRAIKSYAAYHYTILCAMAAQQRGPWRRELTEELVRRKDLLRYDLDRKVRMVRYVSNVIGIRLTIRLLSLYLNCRPSGRKKKTAWK